MSQVKSRRAQYSEATRAALLSAATRRFADRGFAGTALEDVAADIRATRGAVYHHFANKTALFEAVFEQLESDAVTRAATAARAAPDPWAAAMAALSTFLDDCCDPVYGRVVWQEAPLALGWHRWREAEEKFAYGLVEQLLGALMDTGVIERQPLETTTRITFALLMAAGLALAEAPEEDKDRLKAEYGQVIARLVYGLRVATPDA
ncbi:MAG TPA: TetR family transcriptional regulator [Actinophytocola sp.]|uniref:TetR/AcrR family transcriptional regulator n=1 Tax=Actinophytocola sp. TaxID=1872138 RepID=UPI002DB7BC99|nr:TetR family transcriptional regulator [Actinophytocola sp.]HEU5474785.1 TetR family transcriptional regulator [Actinophytocola sp.]